MPWKNTVTHGTPASTIRRPISRQPRSMPAVRSRIFIGSCSMSNALRSFRGEQVKCPTGQRVAVEFRSILAMLDAAVDFFSSCRAFSALSADQRADRDRPEPCVPRQIADDQRLARAEKAAVLTGAAAGAPTGPLTHGR
jgi:hypothetical protein